MKTIVNEIRSLQKQVKNLNEKIAKLRQKHKHKLTNTEAYYDKESETSYHLYFCACGK